MNFNKILIIYMFNSVSRSFQVINQADIFQASDTAKLRGIQPPLQAERFTLAGNDRARHGNTNTINWPRLMLLQKRLYNFRK